MTDTSASPTPQPAAPPPKKHGRLFRILQWLRDRESPKVSQHYVKFGIWSSRIYAILLFPIVIAIALAAPRLPSTTMLWFTLLWCVFWSHVYFWYQGKEIIAYPIVQEHQADRDLMNSILPLISWAVLVSSWVLVNALHWFGVATIQFAYSEYGWIVLLNALLDVGYDLLVNTRVMINLSKVPGRAEFATLAPPAS